MEGQGDMRMVTMGGKVGSYAISTIDMNSNFEEKKRPKIIKKSKDKEIIYKIFIDYLKYLEDPFWIEKFQQASTGKLPSGFNYFDGNLYYKKGNRNYTLELPDNEEEAANLCVEFFRSKGSIFSTIDEKNSIELKEKNISEAKEITWETANKKTQQVLLSYFVISLKNSMKLDTEQLIQLRETIILGIANKYFGKHNIKMINNRINNIEGLLYDNNLKLFYINPELKPKISRSSNRTKNSKDPFLDFCEKDMIPHFKIKWYKYIDNLAEKMNKRRKVKKITINNPNNRLKIINTNETSNTDITDAGTDVITDVTDDSPDNSS